MPSSAAVGKDTSESEHKLKYGLGKQKLLDAAARLAAREGSTRLSLRELAKESGMSHNAIYRHFDGLDDLIPQLLSSFVAQLREGLQQARARVPAHAVPTQTVVGWLFDFALTNQYVFVLAMRERHGPLGPARQAVEQGFVLIMADMRRDFMSSNILPPVPEAALNTALQVIIQQTFQLCLACIETPARRDELLREAEVIFRMCLAGVAVMAQADSAK